MARYRLYIEGMTCTHCEEAVRRALEGVGVRVVAVSWRVGQALVEGEAPEPLKAAVERVGYRVVGVERVQRQEGSSAQLDVFLSGTPSEAEFRTLLVIGSGSAAFAAAIEARRTGARVVMITGDRFGGTCVNVGCVPSKFLLHRAHIRHTLRMPPPPLAPCEVAFSMEALQEARRDLIQTLLREKYADVADRWGIEHIPGKARFVDARTVEVNGKRIPFERAVLATGARPWVPPIPGLKEAGFWTSTEALESPSVPERLAVIGASAVGLELAQAYARLGAWVVLLEIQPRIAPFEEPELSEVLEEALRAEGIEIRTGVQIVQVARTPAGRRVHLRDQAPVEVDAIIVATGRRPNTEGLNLEAAGVAVDGRGAVQVDAELRTTNPRVYAAGDVTPHPQFVYLASRMGQIAARNALGVGRERFDPSLAPRVIFTDPELASVGLTEARAREAGFLGRTVVMDLDVVARARVEGRTGRVKLVLDPSDRLIGVHLCMPRAGEAIYAAHLALKAGLRAQDLVDSFAPYLTYAEALRLAAQALDTDVRGLSCCP